MSNVGNKYKVGVLVIISFVFLILSLLSLGVMKYFKKTYDFMTVVESSVQGLEKGAKVKFKGVTIGEVSKIQITPRENVIYIFMKFDPDAFARKASDKVEGAHDLSKKDEKFFRENIVEAIDRGLRCQLQLAGITGALFVDISYYDPKTHPYKKYVLPKMHPPFIPAIPSVSITNILEEVQKSVVKIGKVDFEKISNQIDEFLITANKLINDKAIKETITEVKKISNNLQTLTNTLKKTFTEEKMDEIGAKFDKTLKNVNSTLDDISTLINNADEKIGKADIPATTKAARGFLDEGKVAFERTAKLEKDIKKSLRKLDAALHSLKELTDYLEKNPSALLKGKAEKPVVQP